MRTSRLTLLALALLPALSLAQSQPTSPTGAARRPITAIAVRASLRGIQLTDAQKTSVKTLTTQYQPKLAVARESMKTWRTKLEAARQKNDTAGVVAARKALRSDRRQVATVTRAALVDVRSKLTTPQQAQFDKNVPRVRRMMTRFVVTGRRPG